MRIEKRPDLLHRFCQICRNTKFYNQIRFQFIFHLLWRLHAGPTRGGCSRCAAPGPI